MNECPTCGSHNNVVTDSRQTGKAIRRRRRCGECGDRWTTYEVSAAFVAFALEVAQIAGPLMQAAQAIGVAADDYEVARYANADSVGHKPAGKRRKGIKGKRRCAPR